MKRKHEKGSSSSSDASDEEPVAKRVHLDPPPACPLPSSGGDQSDFEALPDEMIHLIDAHLKGFPIALHAIARLSTRFYKLLGKPKKPSVPAPLFPIDSILDELARFFSIPLLEYTSFLWNDQGRFPLWTVNAFFLQCLRHRSLEALQRFSVSAQELRLLVLKGVGFSMERLGNPHNAFPISNTLCQSALELGRIGNMDLFKRFSGFVCYSSITPLIIQGMAEMDNLDLLIAMNIVPRAPAPLEPEKKLWWTNQGLAIVSPVPPYMALSSISTDTLSLLIIGGAKQTLEYLVSHKMIDGDQFKEGWKKAVQKTLTIPMVQLVKAGFDSGKLWIPSLADLVARLFKPELIGHGDDDKEDRLVLFEHMASLYPTLVYTCLGSASVDTIKSFGEWMKSPTVLERAEIITRLVAQVLPPGYFVTFFEQLALDTEKKKQHTTPTNECLMWHFLNACDSKLAGPARTSFRTQLVAMTERIPMRAANFGANLVVLIRWILAYVPEAVLRIQAFHAYSSCQYFLRDLREGRLKRSDDLGACHASLLSLGMGLLDPNIIQHLEELCAILNDKTIFQDTVTVDAILSQVVFYNINERHRNILTPNRLCWLLRVFLWYERHRAEYTTHPVAPLHVSRLIEWPKLLRRFGDCPEAMQLLRQEYRPEDDIHFWRYWVAIKAARFAKYAPDKRCLPALEDDLPTPSDVAVAQWEAIVYHWANPADPFDIPFDLMFLHVLVTKGQTVSMDLWLQAICRYRGSGLTFISQAPPDEFIPALLHADHSSTSTVLKKLAKRHPQLIFKSAHTDSVLRYLLIGKVEQ